MNKNENEKNKITVKEDLKKRSVKKTAALTSAVALATVVPTVAAVVSKENDKSENQRPIKAQTNDSLISSLLNAITGSTRRNTMSSWVSQYTQSLNSYINSLSSYNSTWSSFNDNISSTIRGAQSSTYFAGVVPLTNKDFVDTIRNLGSGHSSHDDDDEEDDDDGGNQRQVTTNEIGKVQQSLTDLLAKFSSARAEGSSTAMTLNLSSGLQWPDGIKGLFGHISHDYHLKFPNSNSWVDEQYIENHFKFFYTIGSDTKEHPMAIGANSWTLPDLKPYMVNGQLPDITINAAFDFSTGKVSDTLNTPELNYHGAFYVIHGGAKPSTVFQNLSDYTKFDSQAAANPATAGHFSQFTVDGTGVAGVTSPLAVDLSNIVKGITYSGTTRKINVHLSELPVVSQQVKNFIDSSSLYQNGIYPSLYYGIGNSTDLTEIETQDFELPSDVVDKVINVDGKGPYLPDISYYYVLSKKDNFGTPLRGYGGADHKFAYFNYVGVKLDDSSLMHSYDPKTMLTSKKLQGVSDIISSLEKPASSNDLLDTRSVTETIPRGIIQNETVNGQFVRKPLVEFRYAIGSYAAGDASKIATKNWFTKDQFFGAGKPGSTSEALSKGVIWKAVPINGAVWDPQFTLPTGMSKLGSSDSTSVVGAIAWSVPLVTNIPAPTFASFTDSMHYSVQLNLPKAQEGAVKYWFSLVDSSNQTVPINGKQFVSFEDLKNLEKAGKLPNLYDVATGSFYSFKWSAIPLNPLSAASSTNGSIAIGSGVPDATHRAIAESIPTSAQPTLSSASEDTSHIKISIPEHSPFNFLFSVGGSWYPADSNNFLGDTSGTLLNSFDGIVRHPVSWRLSPTAPVSNPYVTYTGSETVSGAIYTQSLPKYVVSTSIPTLVVDTNSNTMNFGINDVDAKGTPFPAPLEYSIDGKTWFTKDDFLKLTPQGDNLYYSDAFNGSRNLFDGSAARPILFRSKPNASITNPGDRYVFSESVARQLGLTYDSATQEISGSISTSALPVAIDSTIFTNPINVPTMTGTNSVDYTITAPQTSNITYEFKLQNEGEGSYLSAADFKASHGNINKQVNGSWVVQNVVWRAVAANGFKFANSSRTIVDKGFINAANGEFIAQTLTPVNPLSPQIPVDVTAPALMGSNTNNLTINSPSHAGVTYKYSVDGTNWKMLSEFKGTDILAIDGKTKLPVQWKAELENPYIAADASKTSGTLSVDHVNIAISSVNALTASVFGGSDSLNWNINENMLNQPGVQFSFTIDNKKYTLDELKSQAGKMNLYDQSVQKFKQISWEASAAPGFVFVGTPKISGTIRPTLSKYLAQVEMPVVSGIASNNYKITENTNTLKEVSFTYSNDGVNWKSLSQFKADYPNLYDVDADRLASIWVHTAPQSGYTLNSAVIDEKLAIPANMTLVSSVDVSSPQVMGTTSTNYSLPDRETGAHYSYRYTSRMGGGYVTAAEFKAAHPNLHDNNVDTNLEIQYMIVSDAGYQFSGQGVVGKVASLQKIVDVTKLPKLEVNKNGTTQEFTVQKADEVKGIEWRYTTNKDAADNQYMNLQDFMSSSEGTNLYDSVHGRLSDLYAKPFIAGSGSEYGFSAAPEKQKIDITGLTKIINSISAPTLSSPTNSTNDYTITPSATAGVTFKYTQSANSVEASTPAELKQIIPNIWTGNVLYSLGWKAEANDGFAFAKTGVTPYGDFTPQSSTFKKIYDAVPAPSLLNSNPTQYVFDDPNAQGLTYQYFIGSEKPVDFATFKSTHHSIYDSANKKFFEIHWVATSDTLHGFASPQIATGIINTANANPVITGIEAPKFDEGQTKDSHDWNLQIPSPAQVNTQFRINNQGSWMSYADLQSKITSQFGGNLYQQVGDQFVQIQWQITPVNPNASIDPAIATSGDVVFRDGQDDLAKWVVASTPTFTGTSTLTSTIVPSNLGDHFDYTFGIDDSEKLTWDQFKTAHPNLYDASAARPSLSQIHWQATPKTGFASNDATSHGVVSIDNIPKYVDFVNALTLTGTSTEDYNFNGATDGIKYYVDTNEKGAFTQDEAAFKASHSNIAGLTLYYKAVSTDASKYIIAPTAAIGTISSSLKIAIAQVATPSFDKAHPESNNWTIQTPTTGVDYVFSISGDTKTYSASDFRAKYLDGIYNPISDSFNIVSYELRAHEGYVFSKDIAATSLKGTLDTSVLSKVITSVQSPALAWSAKAENASNNYNITTPTSAVKYELSLDDDKHFTPADQFVKVNLYNAVDGTVHKLFWKASPIDVAHKVDGATLSGEIPTDQVKVNIIDAVAQPTVTGKSTGKNINFQGVTPNVEYFYVDKNDATPQLQNLKDFQNSHPNIFNSITLGFDDVRFAVKAANGFKLSAVSNDYIFGVNNAAPVQNLNNLSKVVDTVEAPILGGQAKTWAITDKETSNPAYTYEYKITGENDSTYTTKQALKTSHSDLDFNGSNHGITWRATASSTYEFSAKAITTGDLAELSSNLEIKSVSAPSINFTDSHNFTLGAQTTPNVTYQFRAKGETDYKNFAEFKSSHSNLYDVNTDMIKDVEWTALPDTSNPGAEFHFTAGITTSGLISTQTGILKYVGDPVIPTLSSTAAMLSTNITVSEPTQHVLYQYQIDSGSLLSAAQLKTEYAKLNWENAIGEIAFAISPMPGYAMGETTAADNIINTSNVIKVVNPSAVTLTAKSQTTSDYGLESLTTKGLDYKISVNNQTPVALTEFLKQKQALFTIDNDGQKLSSLTWSVSPKTGYALADHAVTSGTIDLSNLIKVIDNVPAPILSGTNTQDYNLSVDPKFASILDYEYSLTPNDADSFVPFDDFKAANPNIYDLTTASNLDIFARPKAIAGKAQFATSPKPIAVKTQSLVSIINTITEPALTADSATTKDYQIKDDQIGVDYQYSTDNKTWMSWKDFKSQFTNLYLFGQVLTIHWQASASTTKLNKNLPLNSQKFAFGSDAVITGDVSGTDALKKVIESLPQFEGKGSSTNVDIIDPLTTVEPALQGASISYTYGNVQYNSLSELKAALGTTNLYNVRSNDLRKIAWTIAIDTTGYIYEGSQTNLTGTVDLSKITKVVDYINPDWLPSVKSGSTQWDYDFITNEPSYMKNVFDYKYATDANPVGDIWSDAEHFKADNTPLLNADMTNKKVFYNVSLPQGYEWAQNTSHTGEINLPFSSIVSKISTPSFIPSDSTNGYTSRILKAKASSLTSHITYKYRIAGDSEWKSLEDLISVGGFNTYDWSTNSWKTLQFKAIADNGYQIDPALLDSDNGVHKDLSDNKEGYTGNIDMTNSGLVKTLEQFVSPTLSGQDSLHYSLVSLNSNKLTDGIEYLISVNGANPDTPENLMKNGINLVDGHGDFKLLKWVVKVQPGFSLLASGNAITGSLTPPQSMIKIISEVKAPTLGSTESRITSENWVAKEDSSSAFHFAYSFDNNSWFSKDEIKQQIKNGNLWENSTNQMKTMYWKALPQDALVNFGASVNPLGEVAIDPAMIKIVDEFNRPTIPAGSTSTRYSFVETTNNVKYEYKLASESDFTSASVFIANHHNLYDEDAGILRNVVYRVMTNNGFQFAKGVIGTESNIDLSTIENKVIENIPAASIAAGGTTKNYSFSIPAKAGISYEFAISEKGPFHKVGEFRKLYKNLFSVENGLSHVFWRAIPQDGYEFDLKANATGPVDINSLIKIIEVDSVEPQFTSDSNTNRWDIKPLDTQSLWIDHYEFKLSNETQYQTLEAFHNVHQDLNAAKDNNLLLQWKAVYKTNFEANPGVVTAGSTDLSVLETKLDTSGIDTAAIKFDINSNDDYVVKNIPQIEINKGYHIEFTWGDEPDAYMPVLAYSVFSEQTPVLSPSELWDNFKQNADGSFGEWKHGGSISFKVVPDNANISITSDQKVTINFDQVKLQKIIENLPITVKDEAHVANQDVHFAFLPAFTANYDATDNTTLDRQGNRVLASMSTKPELLSWDEHDNNVKYLANPFYSMGQSDIDALLSTFTSERFTNTRIANPDLFPSNLTFEQLQKSFQAQWLNKDDLNRFFAMAGDLWTGSSWAIKSIAIKPEAVDASFRLVNTSPRIVWDQDTNSIAKVTDTSDIYNEIITAIQPWKMAGSVNDNVNWGSSKDIQNLINHARAKHLQIEFQATVDADNNPIWVKLSDFDDPESFTNKIKEISQKHEERKLMVRISSTDTDIATGAQVKVTNAGGDITIASGIQKVKTKITGSGQFNTHNIKISGYTDGDINVDESAVAENFIQVTYRIKQSPDQVFASKEQLIAKIVELRAQNIVVYGEDITANIGLSNTLNDKYTLGEKIEGPIDYSGLITRIDVSKYVDALKNDIALDGHPNQDPNSTEKTILITLDNSTLTSPDFVSRFGIQYRIDNGEWDLFNPLQDDVEADQNKGITKGHVGGTYMAVKMLDNQKAEFRIVPIATAAGQEVINAGDANYSEKEIYEKSRVLISDWDQSAESNGTIVTRDSSEIIAFNENLLIQSINETKTNVLNAAKDKLPRISNEEWRKPFWQLITSRPKFENIQDEFVDVNAKGPQSSLTDISEYDLYNFVTGKLVALDREAAIDALISNGLITIEDKYIIAKDILMETKYEPLSKIEAKITTDANGEKDYSAVFKEVWNRGVSTVPVQSLASIIYKKAKEPNNPVELDIIRNIVRLNNLHTTDVIYNRELIQSGRSSFEITQIGRGTIDQFGNRFTHSNTIFFGTNAIRFNLIEDPKTYESTPIDAYLVAEDSKVEEKIAKIHVSTSYDLTSMSLVLELENGQIIYLSKDIDGSSQGEASEVIRFVRLDSKVNPNGEILDYRTNGAIWRYASESKIENSVNGQGVEETNIQNVVINGDSLAKTASRWVASDAELAEHTQNNELPFDMNYYDNQDQQSNQLILGSTPFERQLTGIQDVNSIYHASRMTNPIAKADEASNPLLSGDAWANMPTLSSFATSEHFKDENNYSRQLVFEQVANDEKGKTAGYVVVKDIDPSGTTKIRVIKQGTEAVSVTELLLDEKGDKISGDSAFPLWAIILTSIGSAAVLAGASYWAYNKYVLKKAVKRMKPISIIKRKR